MGWELQLYIEGGGAPSFTVGGWTQPKPLYNTIDCVKILLHKDKPSWLLSIALDPCILQKASTTRVAWVGPYSNWATLHWCSAWRTNSQQKFLKGKLNFVWIVATMCCEPFCKITCWHITHYLIVMSCAIQYGDYMTKILLSSCSSSKIKLKLWPSSIWPPHCLKRKFQNLKIQPFHKTQWTPFNHMAKTQPPKMGWHGTLS